MILLLGSEGNIGKRYKAILRDLDIPFIGIDPKLHNEHFVKDTDFDKAIIAVPTEYHFALCNLMMDLGKPFLCEKPLSKNTDECKHLAFRAKTEKANGFVVNNWQFVMPSEKIKSIEYENYHTGSDGLAWDMCQLIYIAFKNNSRLHIDTKNPVWSARINGEAISLRDVHWSYVDLVKAFTNEVWQELWTLQDGLLMTQAVLRYQKEIKF